MLYDSILARSFSKHEQKKFKYGALIGLFVIALSFCTVLKPYLAPLPAARKYYLLYILLLDISYEALTLLLICSKFAGADGHWSEDANGQRYSQFPAYIQEYQQLPAANNQCYDEQF